jgi:multidrug efflux system outer membrane protein
MNRRVLHFSATLGVLVSGCTVGPNYREPPALMPAEWSTSLAGGENGDPAALGSWWAMFKDPQLDDLIATAEHENLPLRIAQARIREARAERDVVAGAQGPDLATEASYTRDRFSANGWPQLPGIPLDYSLYTVGFDASWELDVFGGTRRAVEAANAELGAAEYSRRDLLVSLLAEVARSYIDARAYQQRLAVTRQNIAVEQDILNLTRSRFQSGLSGDLDVQQATALLTSTQSQVPSLQASFDRSVHHLAILIAQPPAALQDRMSGIKPIPLTPPDVPVGLPSDLLRRRPDIQRTERELAAATARIGAATAELFPKFSLTGDIGLVSMSPGRVAEAVSRSWTAGPVMQWNLFEAGRLRANIRVQNARQQQALDSYQQGILLALEDVENALNAYAKEHTRRDSLQQSVDANQQALGLSRQLYQNGLVDFLQVLDSERALYATQAALIESDQAVAVNLVQLYKALGGGWEDQAPCGGGPHP